MCVIFSLRHTAKHVRLVLCLCERETVRVLTNANDKHHKYIKSINNIEACSSWNGCLYVNIKTCCLYTYVFSVFFVLMSLTYQDWFTSIWFRCWYSLAVVSPLQRFYNMLADVLFFLFHFALIICQWPILISLIECDKWNKNEQFKLLIPSA